MNHRIWIRICNRKSHAWEKKENTVIVSASYGSLFSFINSIWILLLGLSIIIDLYWGEKPVRHSIWESANLETYLLQIYQLGQEASAHLILAPIWPMNEIKEIHAHCQAKEQINLAGIKLAENPV